MPKCQGIKLDGQQCTRLVPEGKKYCHDHGPWKQIRRWATKKKITIGTVLAIIVTAIGLFADLNNFVLIERLFPTPMEGEFRIAVVDYSEQRFPWQPNNGEEIAQTIYRGLDKAFSELDSTLDIELREPDRLMPIKGNSPDKRAQSAARLAEHIDADLIIYGTVVKGLNHLQVNPEFYIAATNSYEAEEIKGQHAIGRPINLPGNGNVADRKTLGDEFSLRTQIITHIVVGLSYYSNRNYDPAMDSFMEAEKIDGWGKEGKEIIHLLIGNAAGKNGNFELAKSHYKKALELNPDYSRGYLGLGDMYYRLAIRPFEISGNPTDIDLGLIVQAIKSYEMAYLASEKPPLSDTETKASFGLGQSQLMEIYANNTGNFAPAISLFETVIEDYGRDANPRVRDLAAESHARLGLIYSLTGDLDRAAYEYFTAASLLDDNPERQTLYAARSETLGTPQYYDE